MRRALSLLALSATLFVGACAGASHHHYAPYEGNRRWFRTLEPVPAPADVVGYRVVRPSANYPLITCVVSGVPLGPSISSIPPVMDGPMAIVYRGTEIQFCCSACIEEFRKDPEPYLAKARAERT